MTDFRHRTSRLLLPKVIALFIVLITCSAIAGAQTPARVSLDDAIKLAIEHSHTLKATQTQILQGQANEVTANLRPNPLLSWDAQFIPIFEPAS